MYGWDTSLVGPFGAWQVRAARWASLEDPQRTALVRLGRKLAKKKHHLRVVVHPGGVTTAKPVGTRMGGGKGRPRGRRTWLARGQPLFDLTGPVGFPPGRSGLALQGGRRFY